MIFDFFSIIFSAYIIPADFLHFAEIFQQDWGHDVSLACFFFLRV